MVGVKRDTLAGRSGDGIIPEDDRHGLRAFVDMGTEAVGLFEGTVDRMLPVVQCAVHHQPENVATLISVALDVYGASPDSAADPALFPVACLHLFDALDNH